MKIVQVQQNVLLLLSTGFCDLQRVLSLFRLLLSLCVHQHVCSPLKHYPVLNWLCACVFVIKPLANMQSWIYTSSLFSYSLSHTHAHWVSVNTGAMSTFVNERLCFFLQLCRMCAWHISKNCSVAGKCTWVHTVKRVCCFLVFKPSRCVFAWGSDQISGDHRHITSEMFEQLMDKVYKVWVRRFLR